MNRKNRFQQFENRMTRYLLTDLILFIFYIIFAACNVVWLKVLLSIAVVLLSSGCLAILYISNELKKPRSLWMTTAAISITACLVFSLMLNFP